MECSDVTADSLILHWTRPSRDGGSAVSNYIIESKHEGSDDWHKVASVEGHHTKYKVKNLEENSRYIFRISAVNEIGSGHPVQSDSVLVKGPIGMYILRKFKLIK